MREHRLIHQKGDRWRLPSKHRQSERERRCFAWPTPTQFLFRRKGQRDAHYVFKFKNSYVRNCLRFVTIKNWDYWHLIPLLETRFFSTQLPIFPTFCNKAGISCYKTALPQKKKPAFSLILNLNSLANYLNLKIQRGCVAQGSDPHWPRVGPWTPAQSGAISAILPCNNAVKKNSRTPWISSLT